jgi:mono/diheme cytochrome c family protein
MVRLVLGFIAAVVVAGGASAQTAVERGSYLVNTIMTCGNCHSPKGPPAAVAGKDFSGGLRFDEKPFDVTAPNITPDKETGIGNWTDAQIKTAILTGKRPDGIQLAEVMPTSFYPILTEGDLNAIVAYLRSLKPVKNKVPAPIYKIALPGVPHAVRRRRRTGFQGFARQGRPRIPRAVGRVEVAQYHCEQDRRHRRLDRRPDQDCDHPGQA